MSTIQSLLLGRIDMVSKFLFRLDVNSKEQLLYELAKILIDDEVFINIEELYNALMERENDISTGVGMKIAMPHLQVNNNKKDVIYYFDLLKPIDYNSIDQVPVELGFLIISNKDQNNH